MPEERKIGIKIIKKFRIENLVSTGLKPGVVLSREQALVILNSCDKNARHPAIEGIIDEGLVEDVVYMVAPGEVRDYSCVVIPKPGHLREYGRGDTETLDYAVYAYLGKPEIIEREQTTYLRPPKTK